MCSSGALCRVMQLQHPARQDDRVSKMAVQVSGLRLIIVGGGKPFKALPKNEGEIWRRQIKRSRKAQLLDMSKT